VGVDRQSAKLLAAGPREWVSGARQRTRKLGVASVNQNRLRKGINFFVGAGPPPGNRTPPWPASPQTPSLVSPHPPCLLLSSLRVARFNRRFGHCGGRSPLRRWCGSAAVEVAHATARDSSSGSGSFD
jgi:hypothetical protein